MRHVLGLLLVLFAAFPLRAEVAAIGYVKIVTGEASVTTAEKSVKAEVGTPVMLGSKLKTGPNSSLGVTFKDETRISIGPVSELTIDEYFYAPAQGKLKISSKMSKGSLNYVSGVIAKLKPDAVTLTTPSGTIGVRGTQFLVRIEE